MSTVAPPRLMTTEEFLALPDDGIERDLIRGVVKKYGMTRRNRRHSRTTTKAAKHVDLWLDRQSPRRGEVLCGDAGFQLLADPDTTVGIDLAYISAEVAARFDDDVYLIEAAPILAAEILSPSDTHEDIVEKIELLLKAGVNVVWIIDPDLRTVTVYRPDKLPILFNASQELAGDPELPGFRVKVAELFGSAC